MSRWFYTIAKQNPLPKPCGENNKSSKLKEHQVREIRRLCKETNMTDYDIAKLFDVHAKTIYDIRRYKIWKHVID